MGACSVPTPWLLVQFGFLTPVSSAGEGQPEEALITKDQALQIKPPGYARTFHLHLHASLNPLTTIHEHWQRPEQQPVVSFTRH